MSKDSFKVRRVRPSDASEVIILNHYAHRLPSISYAFGLFEDQKMRGICTFGTPASHSLCIGIAGERYSHYVIELNRLYVDSKERNISSWFVSRCLNLIRGSMIVVSYADTAMGHVGTIYKACNFLFTGTTRARTDIGAGDNKHSRHYEKSTDYSVNRVNRSAKHRYVYITGPKRDRKRLTAALKYEVLPYPIGQSERYETGNAVITQGLLL